MSNIIITKLDSPLHHLKYLKKRNCYSNLVVVVKRVNYQLFLVKLQIMIFKNIGPENISSFAGQQFLVATQPNHSLAFHIL